MVPERNIQGVPDSVAQMEQFRKGQFPKGEFRKGPGMRGAGSSGKPVYAFPGFTTPQ